MKKIKVGNLEDLLTFDFDALEKSLVEEAKKAVEYSWGIDDRDWETYEIDDDYTPYIIHAYGNGKGVVYHGAHTHIIGIDFRGDVVFQYNLAKMERA